MKAGLKRSAELGTPAVTAQVTTRYHVCMDVELKDAKAGLSRLIKAALAGESVTITDRGKPLVKLVPLLPQAQDVNRGYGSLHGVLRLSDGWDSMQADEEIVRMFEGLH